MDNYLGFAILFLQNSVDPHVNLRSCDFLFADGAVPLAGCIMDNDEGVEAEAVEVFAILPSDGDFDSTFKVRTKQVYLVLRKLKITRICAEKIH